MTGKSKANKWAARQRYVGRLTWFFYILALVTCLYWFFADQPRIEPWAVIFALITAGLGSYSQFRVTPMLARSMHLNALVHEIIKNLSIYKEEYSTVPDREVELFKLPQYHLSAVEFCISQGVLDSRSEQTLLTMLHDTHDRVRQINSMLAIEEVGMRGRFSKESGRRDKYKMIVEGAAMRSIKSAFDNLGKLLMTDEYVALHGIDSNTIVFPD